MVRHNTWTNETPGQVDVINSGGGYDSHHDVVEPYLVTSLWMMLYCRESVHHFNGVILSPIMLNPIISELLLNNRLVSCPKYILPTFLHRGVAKETSHASPGQQG